MNVQELKLSQITLGQNYRLNMSEQDVSGLMASIKREGLLNPITVKRKGKKFQILAGYRRFCAIKKLGLKTIPSNIKEGATNSVIINLIENLQREDTSSWEVGRGIHQLRKKENMSTDEVAIRLGVPKTSVKMYEALYSDVPKEFRDIVKKSPKGTQNRNGFIPNDVAFNIVQLKKGGLINAKQVKELFNIVKKDGKITGKQIRSIGAGMKTGKTFNETKISFSDERVFNVTFSLSKKDLKKVERKYKDKFHVLARKIVAKELKIKIR